MAAGGGHEVAQVLWGIDVALLLVTGYSAVQTARGLGEAQRADAAAANGEASARLEGRPPLVDLEMAWGRVIRRPPPGDDWPGVRRLIADLCHADDEAVADLRGVVERSVNCYNHLAMRMDQGVVRASEFVRRYPALHRAALADLALVEPFVWYDSLVGGRGRWGYRPIQLARILHQLRPLSDDASLCRAIGVTVLGRSYVVEKEIRIPRRVLLHARCLVKQPTINVRTKVKQKRRASNLREWLTSSGYAVAQADPGRGAVEW